jgi:hypothetical protein
MTILSLITAGSRMSADWVRPQPEQQTRTAATAANRYTSFNFVLLVRNAPRKSTALHYNNLSSHGKEQALPGSSRIKP